MGSWFSYFKSSPLQNYGMNKRTLSNPNKSIITHVFNSMKESGIIFNNNDNTNNANFAITKGKGNWYVKNTINKTRKHKK